MTHREPNPNITEVAHIGDFTVDNWGDQLYPLALRHLLKQNGLGTQGLRHYALRAGPLPGGTAARAMHPHAMGHDVALVGGGDLIRADYLTIAQDRLNIPSDRRTTRYNRLRGRVHAAMRLPKGAGPWLPTKGWGERTRTSLVSVGVHPLPAELEVKQALTKVDFAWVRTNEAADRLTSAGLSGDRLIAAPDMIFAHPWLDEARALRAEGLTLASSLGIETPPVVFQAAPFHGWDVTSVEAILRRLKSFPILTLALGRYAGEDQLLAAAAGRAGVPSLKGLSVRETMAILAYAGCVITSSMHAAIVGAALGVPVIDAGTGKTRSALSVCPKPPDVIYGARDDLFAAVDEYNGKVRGFDRAANLTPIRSAFSKALEAVGLAPQV